MPNENRNGNQSVKRHELKYYINNLEYHALIARLQQVMKPDQHSKPGKGYFIRSLYFDSYTDTCLYEKQSGTHTRQKYRMRIYDLDSQKVKFEIKNKANNQIFKETATITKSSALAIIAGDYHELLSYNNPVLNKIYIKFSSGLYRPKVIVDYYRDAFILDFFNCRITIDRDLHSNNTDFNLFSKAMHTIPVILEGKQILEVKYNDALPEQVKVMLQLETFERQAISKYTLSRRFLKTRSWEDN
jgi:hypothetical protein